MKTMPLEVGPTEPKAALEFWKGKAQLTPAEFTGLTHAARARAFAVSGIARREQIAEIHAALQTALEQGETPTAIQEAPGAVAGKEGLDRPESLAGGEHLPHQYAKRLYGRALPSLNQNRQAPPLLALPGRERQPHPPHPPRPEQQSLPS